MVVKKRECVTRYTMARDDVLRYILILKIAIMNGCGCEGIVWLRMRSRA